MIRKARNFDMSATDPTPDEIRQRSEAIRKAWSPRERVRRSGFKRISWLPPTFSDADFSGLLPSDLESR
jgi:hypothetical protein